MNYILLFIIALMAVFGGVVIVSLASSCSALTEERDQAREDLDTAAEALEASLRSLEWINQCLQVAHRNQVASIQAFRDAGIMGPTLEELPEPPERELTETHKLQAIALDLKGRAPHVFN